MIECNYDERKLNDRLRQGSISRPQAERLLKSHMSLQNLCVWLKSQNLDEVQQIYLLHLSRENADRKICEETIKKLTGKPVIVCAP